MEDPTGCWALEKAAPSGQGPGQEWCSTLCLQWSLGWRLWGGRDRAAPLERGTVTCVVTAICCSCWLVFYDPIAETCFGAGKMKEFELLQQSGTGLGDPSRVSSWGQMDQDSSNDFLQPCRVLGRICAINLHSSP